jgi:hypothetical protein
LCSNEFFSQTGRWRVVRCVLSTPVPATLSTRIPSSWRFRTAARKGVYLPVLNFIAAFRSEQFHALGRSSYALAVFAADGRGVGNVSD